MCGISGFIDFSKGTELGVLKRMTDALVHRGPDDSGFEIIKSETASVGLGFRRLSIIELSQLGHQPMFSSDKKCCIVFNGEIYNFKEIRKVLEREGYAFVSNSDTEVILNAFHKWGTECVNRFIGMFAIAIHDSENQKVYLFRDRVGVKPLFYYQKDDLFLFASELKSFHQHPRFQKEINLDALSFYFQLGYISAPHCIFKNAFKLEPGHFLELDLLSRKIRTQKYWDVSLAYTQSKENISFEDATSETEKILHSAFQYRMVSDVPVGVFLSGGFDSSAVAALLQKNSSQRIRTFTIGFHEDKYNEAHHAKRVADHLGTEHLEHYCTFREAIDIVPLLPEIYDEPFGDSSAIPTTLVSRIAREHVKVALSADGGDEIFAGYPKYIRTQQFLKIRNLFPEFLTSPFGAIIPPSKGVSFEDDLRDKLKIILGKKDSVLAFRSFISAFTIAQSEKLIQHEVHQIASPFDRNVNSSSDLLSRLQEVDFQTYLTDDILQKVDRATMSVGLEGREPFIDQRIIEWAAKLPSDYKLKNGVSKLILRKIVSAYIPDEIMNRPKMGFQVPVEKWCANELKDVLCDFTDQKKISDQGLLNPEYTKALLAFYFSGRKMNFQKIWFLLMFQMWYEKWMK